MTFTRTHVYITFANPNLACTQCHESVPRWHDPEKCGCDMGYWNEPCRHDAAINSTCPSWGPVDGCRCDGYPHKDHVEDTDSEVRDDS